MAGVDTRTIMDLGGWRSLRMVERYMHLSPAHKAAAVERIATASAVSSEFPNAVPKRVGVRARWCNLSGQRQTGFPGNSVGRVPDC